MQDGSSPESSPVARRPFSAVDGRAQSRRTGVKALITDGSEILLIEERRGDGSTFWTLPGGGVTGAESLVAGLHRELREELDCAVHIAEPIGTCRYRHTSRPDLVTDYWVFQARLLSPPASNPAEGIISHAWVPPDALPESTLVPFARFIREY